MLNSVETLRKTFRSGGHLAMVMRFHTIAADHPEWKPAMLAEVLEYPKNYPEIVEAIVPEFAGMKLLGEI